MLTVNYTKIVLDKSVSDNKHKQIHSMQTFESSTTTNFPKKNNNFVNDWAVSWKNVHDKH